MGYTKIHPIKATVDKAITYICNPAKTEESILISSYGCSPKTAVYDFKFALSKTRQSDENKAYHLIQAFAPGEVTYEEAHRIGIELADKLLEGKYSYIVTTHIDKEHVHNHLLFCAADNIDHKKYHDCKKSYYHIRKLSDTLCKEHGLSIIPPSKQKGKSYKEWMEHKNNTSWKSQLRTDINESIKQANFYEEFLSIIKAKGYEIENTDFNNPNTDITFRFPDNDYFIRGNVRSLGKNFTRERIKERIEQKPKGRAKQMLHSTKINKLIDTSSNKKYKQNVGLQKWAEKQNLKLAAKTYATLNEKGFQSLEELEEQISTLTHQFSSIRTKMVSLEKQIREQALLLKYAEQYIENKPYHDKFMKAKNQDALFRKYESQIILYRGAKEMLKKTGINPAKINPTEIRTDYEKMIQEHDTLIAKYKAEKGILKDLQQLKNTITQYMDMPKRTTILQQQKQQEL